MSYLDPSILHPQPSYQPYHAHQQYPYAAEDEASGSQPNSGKFKGKVAYKESPVKAACLACRAKKAKCDGARPVCGAVSLYGRDDR